MMPVRVHIHFVLSAACLGVMLCASHGFAQERDTSATMALDTVRTVDTLAVYPRKNSVDTLITYSARDSIVYRLNDKVMEMYGEGEITYGSFNLKAERITIDWEKSNLYAKGIPDTTSTDTTALVGTPVFKDAGTEYAGEEMTYNFKSRQGTITKARTEIEGGYYLGERIKRMNDEIFYIRNGRYTTCDDPDHQHYYFLGPKMEVIPQELIVAEPVIFYIEDVPLFALPFALFQSQGGRSSGLVIPTFGEVFGRGKYLKGFGYYWAISDYMDIRFTGDYYFKGGYQVNTFFRYNLRYNFSGSVSASYGRQQFRIGDYRQPDDEPKKDFFISLQHSQEIDPTSRLVVDFRFTSDSYYNNFSTNLNELIQQNAVSNATYSKTWEGTGRSITVNVSRDQNLRTGEVTDVLPNFNFNQSQVYPFRVRGSFGEKWYEQIGINYSASMLNRRNETLVSPDTTDAFDVVERRGIQHNISINASPKVGYFSISPSIRITEKWYDHAVERGFSASDSTILEKEVRRFAALHTFSTSLGMSTKLYGMFMPGIWGIKGIRHQLVPNLSYTFQPDFSDPSWGYYKSYTDERGSEVWYDPYSGEVFGGVPRGEQQALNLSLSNIFEMKIGPAEGDSAATDRKFQLLNMSASMGYNFAADSMRLSDLRVSYRTSIGRLLDINGGASFSPYVFETGGGAPGLRSAYLWDAGRGFLRMTSFNISLSTSLSSEQFQEESATVRDTTVSTPPTGLNIEYGIRAPWSVTLGWDYSINQSDPTRKYKNASFRASFNLRLAEVWNISASGYFDMVQKEFGAPQITISRDLHCWEMNFTWVPLGPYRYFAFIIRIKAPQLRDIKLEKRGSARGVF